MSGVFENRRAYEDNFEFYNKREKGDFSPFYIVVTVCTIVAVCIFVLNIVLGCCSRYSEYWNDRHTGNRWIVSLWTSTPHNQPAIDYTELEDIHISHTQADYFEPPHSAEPAAEFVELQKRESEI